MGPRRRSRRVTPVLVFLVTLVSSGLATSVDADSTGIKLRLVRKVGEGISPKSVVASSGGVVIAQNMMYTHGVTAYDAEGALITRISDAVPMSMLGLKRSGGATGSPVEAAFSADGSFAYVSNYQMYGSGFNKPGFDKCIAADGYDASYVYKVDMSKLRVVAAVRVGAVPKFLAVSPDGNTLLVSNWCSSTISVVDLATFTEKRQILVGRYPRGIAISNDSSVAFIAIMGGGRIARVDMSTWKVKQWRSPNSTPRHIILSPDGSKLYVSHNIASVVAEVNARNGRVLRRVTTGNAPRTMALSPDGAALYVVNYDSNTVSVVDASIMKVVQTVNTPTHPIGVTFEPTKNRVWVASYHGTLLLYDRV
ncbi:MAG: beta-propeller fold lactonase family protein [Ilumatobacteraceae bacterium]|jgi:YVTN family beta-propeller protein|nr:beta-propeller fold lactonase family protein [Ilumatobacteraceae bacterium]